MSDTDTMQHVGDAPDKLAAHRLALARRLRDHILAGTSDLADAPLRIDPRIYTDPVRFAAERQAIFRETPLVACLSSDVAEPGDYFTFDDTGVPILVTRGKDGVVRAFLNVCPHRGARLVRTTAGRASRFSCWFHGWTFMADGKLLAATEPKNFGEALAECNHLTELPAEERHGFVFVVATPGAKLDLDEHLGAFDEQLDMIRIGGLTPLTSRLMEAGSNWKFILDTFYEGYHLASMHAKTLAPNYRNDIHIYDVFGPHFRFVNVARDLEKVLISQPESDWTLDHRWVGSNYIFPNTYVTASAMPAMTGAPALFFYAVFRIFPGDEIGKTKIYLTLYGEPGERDEAFRTQIETTCDAMVHLLTSEDFTMAEEAWLGLSAVPEGQRFVVGRQERLVQELELSIARRIGMPLEGSR